MFERLKRHVAPGGRIYLVGMQPLPDHPGEPISVCSLLLFAAGTLIEIDVYDWLTLSSPLAAFGTGSSLLSRR